MEKKKILIVDDDENICEVLKLYLQDSGYDIRMSHDGKAAQDVFLDYKPDLVLLDIMLPSVDGIDVLKWIRKEHDTRVIMLSAKGETFDIVLALELGADDYMVKPFEPKELIARIKSQLRRINGDGAGKVVSFPELTVDVNSYNVTYQGQNVKMPPKEFELLYHLASNKNRVFTREQLLCEVWGYDYPGDSRTVDVHIKRLREKLHGGPNWQLETVWGVGYKFEVK
ncbi:Response regulator (CheY-like receiver domain and HTH-type DNA-binding domain) [Clostridiaceae bacterium JG1575]|nr:Response regulator (CheY-like receiver domain and HTH-type DNA-binding domain) [Clostridiaceae bacterium JG1575]